MPVVVDTYPDGRAEEYDTDAGIYRLRSADGTVVVERPMTADEVAQVRQPAREQSSTQLHAQARAALTSNADYLAKVDGGTAVQADHITQIARLTRQVNALIRLVVGSDLLD